MVKDVSDRARQYRIIFNLIQCFARNWPWYSLRGLHIRITWLSLYGIRIPLFSLYGIQMPFFSYISIQPIVLCMGLLFNLIQCFARNWPWYSLRGLHSRITWFSLYGIRIPLFSLYGIQMPFFLYVNTAHCSVYGVAMGCYGLFIVPRTAIVTSQWYDRYCFTGYARTWARHPTTRMHGDYIDRFFVEFNAICYIFLRYNPIYIEGRNCRLSTVPGLINKCLGLRTSDTLIELVARLATSCARWSASLW